jgi:hypothetical protein
MWDVTTEALQDRISIMRTLVIMSAFIIVLTGAAGSAEAKGCLKGAVVGGVAGPPWCPRRDRISNRMSGRAFSPTAYRASAFLALSDLFDKTAR